jgi:cold shock CspA family protein
VNGNIKRLLPTKNTGYIVSDTGATFFFHYSHWVGDEEVKLGQPVTFTASESKAGRATALNVRPWEESVPSVAPGLTALTKSTPTDDDLMEQLTEIVDTLSD